MLNLFSIALEETSFHTSAPRRSDRHVYQTDGFIVRAARGPGNPCARDSVVCRKPLARAVGHFSSHLLAHGAVLFERPLVYAE